MKVEKSFKKKTKIPLTEDDPSILKAFAKYQDHKIGRLDNNGYREFDGNIRLIEVIKALDSKESLVAHELGVSVSVVSVKIGASSEAINNTAGETTSG